MFNKDFYPTPPQVARILLSDLYKHHFSGRAILEPSAGKGDLVKAIEEHFGKNRRYDLYMMENDIELCNFLHSLETSAKLIGNDFLNDECYYKPYLIIMNPPFSNGDEHLLRAWELVANEGVIRCVLNAQTYDNPYSEKRKLLKSIIDTNGAIIARGHWFTAAQRQTNVECIVVELIKPKQVEDYDLDFSALKGDNLKELLDDSSNELAIQDNLGNKEYYYKKAIESFEESMKHLQRCNAMMAGCIKDSHLKVDISQYLSKGQDGYNEFVKEFNKNSWNSLLGETDFTKHLTEKSKEKFLQNYSKQSVLMFTKENMTALLSIFRDNAATILDSCILEVFDLLTKYYKENRTHIEGWKTNDVYKVNQKVILPIQLSWYDVEYTSRHKLDDIDRALCYLTGKKLDEITTLCKTVQELYKNKQSGVCADTTFFKIKYFKKGTLHLQFKDVLLWEYFNCCASSLRGYPLPEETTVKNRFNTQKLF